MQREYLDYPITEGYQPTGPQLFYECQICGVSIPTLPTENVHCECENIFIDFDAGRLSIRQHDKVRAFREMD